jgi:hypothetical protein
MVTPDEIEAIAAELDAEQLAHIGTTWIARAAARRQREASQADRLSDPETDAAFAELEPLAVQLLRHAEISRSHGIDDDLIGTTIAAQLSVNHTEEEAAALIAGAGIAWRPRTHDERLVAAAAFLLETRWDSEVVRDAFAGLEVS